MVDIVGFYNSLLQATFGGVPFNVVDTTEEAGRRIVRFLFPGVDEAEFQDLGTDEGPISLRGLLVGEDYIAQKKAMQAVFKKAGPYQLVHPWLGTLQVVLVDGQRPRFLLSARELQVCRFEVQVYVFTPPAAQTGFLNTLAQLELKLDKLTSDGEAWLAAAMAPAVGAVAAFGYIQSWLGNAVAIFVNAVTLTRSAGEIGPAVAGTFIGLANAIGTSTDISSGGSSSSSTATAETFPATASAAVTALMAAWSGSATPLVPSAVAPGGTTTAAPAADPADVVTTLLASMPGIRALATGPAPAPALSAAMQAVLAAAAVQAATSIDYASQQDAKAQEATLFAALDQAIGAAATAAATDPLNVPPVWIDLVEIKSALAADMNALIGRLPAVVTINLPAPMPVWLLAQYVSGDDPSAVYATWQDIIARNGVRHPAMLPAGAIEVLNQ